MKNLIIILPLILVHTLFSQNNELWVGYNHFLFTPIHDEKEWQLTSFQQLNDSIRVNYLYHSLAQNKIQLKDRIGINIGYNYVRKIKDKTALHYGIGLNYQRFKYDITTLYQTTNTLLSVDTVVYYQTIQPSTKQVIFLRPSPDFSFTNEVQNLDIILPCMLEYQIFPQISVLGGVEVWAALFAQSKAKRYTYYVVNETNTVVTYDYRGEDVIDNNTSAVARWGISINGQVAYTINSKNTLSLGCSVRLNNQYHFSSGSFIYKDLSYSTVSPFLRYYYKF